MTISEFMTRDHRELDAMLERALLPGRGCREASVALDRFRQRLGRHIRWEEEILFPLLESRSPVPASAQTEAMRVQHRQIEGQLGDLAEAVGGGAAEAANLRAVLQESLTDHNSDEEAYYYTWIDSLVPPQEAAPLVTRLRA